MGNKDFTSIRRAQSSTKKVERIFLLAICIMFFSFSTYGQNIVHESEINNSTNSFADNGSSNENLKA